MQTTVISPFSHYDNAAVTDQQNYALQNDVAMTLPLCSGMGQKRSIMSLYK